MLKSEKAIIDELEIETTQFPAMRSFEILAKLVKSVGPALSALTGLDPESDIMDSGPQLMAGLATLNPAEASKLVEEVLSCTTATVDGKMIQLGSRANLDFVFSSRLKTMFKVLGHALKVNYQDFAGGSDQNAPLDQTPVG